MNDNRIMHHQVLGDLPKTKWVKITVDGKRIKARVGETIAAPLIAASVKIFRYSVKRDEPRILFCAIGRCTDCVMIVNNRPNVRTCVTLVENGMKIKSININFPINLNLFNGNVKKLNIYLNGKI